ncbi:pyridoxal 4-dehydrogenase [Caulobacter sp. Root487D2Y]|uniref:aldo/keto reductase n=1 Tax=Caulobacter sp. Root487D2Y TaxID=1736547 RepID=UPI000701DFB3|nr:aldo/keto reductase [Caulobacter sp. Root487D2Y]KQY35886.1 pyridoxal 4-dehydrogenase [Caulobacter sp. Root487D2Y]
MTLPDAARPPASRERLNLPPLGFGAAAIGNLYAAMSDDAARETIEAALASGLAYFDTAPHYGFGLSETRLGAVLPPKVKVSTKVGRVLCPAPDVDPAAERHGFVAAAPFEPVFDYSYDGVMRSFEASLERLNRDHVEVLLAHDLGQVTHGVDDAARRRQFFDGGYKAMRALRDGGAVDAIGLGVNEWEICDAALDEAEFDVFLLAGRYTLLEQTALDRFLPRCAARDVSIIVGGPFNSGVLVEGVRAGAHYNYGPASAEILDRVRRLEAVCRAHATPLAAAALRFPLAHPQVVSVIPGMSSPAQVRQALAWAAHPIPDALWDDLRAQDLLHPDAPTPRETR